MMRDLVLLDPRVQFILAPGVLFAHRCVPSQSDIEKESQEKERASLKSYISSGAYIVRFE